MELQHQYGFSYVDNCPISPEKSQELLERISFIRQTHYGGFYDFTSDLSMKDSAYSAEALDAHTDTTYFTDPIGLQMFHLLSHTDGSGGESLLVDGFHCASILAQEDYSAFCVLTKNTGQIAHSSGNEGISVRSATAFPVISTLPMKGSHPKNPILPYLFGIRWNRYDRATHNLSPKHKELTNLWYGAARKWSEIIKRPENEYWAQLRPGRPLSMYQLLPLHET